MTSLCTSLLLLILLPFSSSSTIHDEIARLLKQDQPVPIDFVNDINNCVDGVSGTDDTVLCDAITLAWNTTFLNPAKMPARCIGFIGTVTNADDDYFEPCVWWNKLYGDSASPSSTPSSQPSPDLKAPPTSSPTIRKTSKPTNKIPSAEPSSSPSISIADLPQRELSKFILTLTLPLSNNLRRLSDRSTLSTSDQLIKLTEKHLTGYLGEALSLSIASVSLISVASEYSSSYLVEDLQGRVYFYRNSVLPTPATLDFLVQQAFLGLALDEFLTLLQNNAESSVLQKTLYAEVVTEDDVLDTQPKSVSFFGDFQWTTPWIVICAAGGAAILALFILSLLLCKARCARRDAQDHLEKQNSGETPTTHPEYHHGFDDEANSDVQSDIESDGTSVYSYKHQDDASMSIAPSILHAITERSALGAFYGAESDDDSLQTPSILWNHGGQQDTHVYEPPIRPKSVIVRPNEKEKTRLFQSASVQKAMAKPDDDARSWAYDAAYDGTSAAGDGSLNGDSVVMYLTDDEDAVRNEFSHVWDDETKKADVTTIPDGDISFEESVYSYT